MRAARRNSLACAVRRQREACVTQLVFDLAAQGAHAVVIEQDDSVAAHDKRVLYQ